MSEVNLIIDLQLGFALIAIVLGIVYFFLLGSSRIRVIRIIAIPVTVLFLTAVVWGNVYANKIASVSDDNIAANPDQAIHNLTQALRVDPGSSSAYFKRGIAYLKTKSPQEAYGDLDHAAALSQSTNEVILLKFAQASAELGYTSKALAIINVLLANDPKDFHALIAKGLTETLENQYPAAIKDLETALALSNDDGKRFVARYNLGVALDGIHSTDEAVSDFEIALKLRPKDVRTLAGLAHAYGQKAFLSNRPDKSTLHQQALLFADQALEIDPSDPVAHLVRSAALFYLGQRDLAITEISELITKYPYASPLFVIRAGMYNEMGETDLAHQDSAQSQIAPPASAESLTFDLLPLLW